MKKIKIFSLILFTFFCFMFGIKVNAASWTIISSKASVSGGGSFNVRISGSVAGRFNISVSNGKASTSSIFKDTVENDASFSVTAGNSGSVYIVVTAADVTDSSYNAVSGSDNVSVAIINNSDDGSRGNSYNSNKTTTNNNSSNKKLSDNNKLKSLSIDGYKLSPEFNGNTTSYTVEVDEACEKIKIGAEAEDSKATIEGVGEKSLENDNIYQIVVKAENGKVNTYTIKVIFKDSNPINVIKGKKTYTVVKRKSLIKEFDDYKATTIKIKNIEVPALYNKTTKLTLVGLKYKDDIYLYRYNDKTNNYVRYIEYDFKNIKLVLFKPSKSIIPLGYTETTIKLNGYKVKAYKLKNNSKYSLIYGMNIKTGEKSLYLYDSKENTVQRYTNEALVSLAKTNDKYYNMCICLCGVIALLIIILLIVISKKGNKKSKYKSKKKIKKKEENMSKEEE